MLDNNQFREKTKIVDESWYSLYVVWFITILGLVSVTLGNFIFKIVGIFTVVMGLGIMFLIAKKRREESINKHKEE